MVKRRYFDQGLRDFRDLNTVNIHNSQNPKSTSDNQIYKHPSKDHFYTSKYIPPMAYILQSL